MDLRAAHHMFGLEYVIFRPHNVYGEHQNIGDKYRNVVGIFMNQLLQKRPLTIFGDGEQQRAFSYVGDIIAPIADAPNTPKSFGRVFNVGADMPYTVNRLAASVARAMSIADYQLVHLPERNEVKVAYSEHAAVREVFGEIPQTCLEDGLARMAAWVKRVGARQSKDFGEIEIRRNLPPSWAK
jgi:UDP-glucose 4-epimerase